MLEAVPESPAIEGQSAKIAAPKICFDNLHGAHREILQRAITRVISTEIAELTFAQILDGLPLSSVAKDCSGGGPYDLHPINRTHNKLCPGVLTRLHEHWKSFRLEDGLAFETTLLFEYKAAAPGSRAFNVRLIEMVAISIHQIGVILYNLDTSLHKHNGITNWIPSKTEEQYWRFHPDGPLPTLFHHPWYTDYDQYPNGVADMVGYWAEARILGGVVLFDRKTPSSDDIYFHPSRSNVTYRIFQLLPEQKLVLLDFLTAEPLPHGAAVPIPILGDKKNTKRVDPEEPITETGIYRDLWERKERPPSISDPRLRDVYVVHGPDYVSEADYEASYERASARLYALDDVDAWDSSQDT